MLARIKIKEEQEEKRIKRIEEISKLKNFKFRKLSRKPHTQKFNS